jgi:hypothetical protein
MSRIVPIAQMFGFDTRHRGQQWWPSMRIDERRALPKK